MERMTDLQNFPTNALRLLTWITASAPHPNPPPAESAGSPRASNDFIRPVLSRRSSSASTTSTSSVDTELQDWDYGTTRRSSLSSRGSGGRKMDAWEQEQSEVRRKMRETRRRRTEEVWREFW